jgi:hypothetical protein
LIPLSLDSGEFRRNKNSVYEYMDGKRDLSTENRRAMAEVLGIETDDLPL